MIERLEALDRWLLVAANDAATPALDQLMIFFSDRFTWFPAYLVMLMALGYYFGRRAFLLLPVLLLSVGLADVISSRFFKPFFARLRPCHDVELSAALNLANGCGGRFGFISSHAANAFTLAVFLCLVLPRRFWLVKALVLMWAAMVGYSRIYLAAHFPTDVVAGAALGSLLAAGGYWFYRWGVDKWGIATVSPAPPKS